MPSLIIASSIRAALCGLTAGHLPRLARLWLPTTRLSRFLEFGGEHRRIGEAEVIQLHACGDQMMLKYLVAFRTLGQQDHCPGLFMFVNAAWRILPGGTAREAERTQHLIQLAVGYLGPLHDSSPRSW